MTAYSISRSDDGLAHGTSKWLCDIAPTKHFIDQSLGMRNAPKLSVKRVEASIPLSLKKYVFYRHVKKATGSRANAMWTLLAPLDGFFSVSSINLYQGSAVFFEDGIRVTHHCFARLLQRTSNTSDIAKTVAFLKKPLVGLMYQLVVRQHDAGRAPQGGEATVYTADGKLVLVAEGGIWWAKTWVDTDLFHKGDRERTVGLGLKGDVAIYWDCQ